MLSIFLIGVALSMDAFSLAIGIGTTNIENKQKILLSSTVAIMHFIMPGLGLILGTQILKFLEVNVDIFVIIIFFYLGMMMLIQKEDTSRVVTTSILSYFIFAFCVSIDSFSIGLGLRSLTDHYWLSFAVFSLCSGIITYIGLLLGEYSIKLLKEKAPLLGASILFILAIVNLIEHFF